MENYNFLISNTTTLRFIILVLLQYPITNSAIQWKFGAQFFSFHFFSWRKLTLFTLLVSFVNVIKISWVCLSYRLMQFFLSVILYLFRLISAVLSYNFRYMVQFFHFVFFFSIVLKNYCKGGILDLRSIPFIFKYFSAFTKIIAINFISSIRLYFVKQGVCLFFRKFSRFFKLFMLLFHCRFLRCYGDQHHTLAGW